jgi:hypothetical protein
MSFVYRALTAATVSFVVFAYWVGAPKYVFIYLIFSNAVDSILIPNYSLIPTDLNTLPQNTDEQMKLPKRLKK